MQLDDVISGIHPSLGRDALVCFCCSVEPGSTRGVSKHWQEVVDVLRRRIVEAVTNSEFKVECLGVEKWFTPASLKMKLERRLSWNVPGYVESWYTAGLYLYLFASNRDRVADADETAVARRGPSEQRGLLVREVMWLCFEHHQRSVQTSQPFHYSSHWLMSCPNLRLPPPQMHVALTKLEEHQLAQCRNMCCSQISLPTSNHEVCDTLIALAASVEYCDYFCDCG